ncbi:hypothetical protein AIOGIFDO_00921 [Candidatus Methanoperedenaceae archaeon GB37]|nr:hypothetical protein AIOGIFDO_00921 [Candidatus Methanoperedenaceae archaeon GB37]
MEDEFEVVAVNYWKDVKRELKTLLPHHWKTMLLIHNSIEFTDIKNFLSKIPCNSGGVYISLTKTSDSIKPYINDTNLFVVDCVSATVFEKEDTEGCSFEPPPSNLKALAELIDKYSKRLKPDLIILDSLSQFIDFSQTSMTEGREFYDFLESLRQHRPRLPCRFILLYDHVLSKKLRTLPSFRVDMILRLEVIKEQIAWKD